MSFNSFMYGFATAIVVIVGSVWFGAVKGKSLLKRKLDEMEEERQGDKKAIEMAKKLDPIKVSSHAKARGVGGSAAANKTSTSIKLVVMGSSLSIYTLPTAAAAVNNDNNESPHNDKDKEKLLCRVSTSQLTGAVEKVHGSFKGDPVEGSVLSLTSQDKIFSLGEDEAKTHQIFVKLQTVRELERWTNIFAANNTTKEWRVYVKSLPHLDVFNLFISRIFFENRNSQALNDLIRKKIQKKLTKIKLPSIISGGLTVDYVNAGEEIPIISEVSFVSCSTSGEIGFDFDLLYRGGFQLVLLAGIAVKGLAVPPILLSVTIEELRGRVHLSCGPPPSNKMWIGFHETPTVSIDFKQEVKKGGESRGLLGAFVSLIPDLSDVVSHVVKVQLFEDMVLPNMDDIPLPNVADTPPSSPDQVPLEQQAETVQKLTENQPQWDLDAKQPAAGTAASSDAQQAADDAKKAEKQQQEEKKAAAAAAAKKEADDKAAAKKLEAEKAAAKEEEDKKAKQAKEAAEEKERKLKAQKKAEEEESQRKKKKEADDAAAANPPPVAPSFPTSSPTKNANNTAEDNNASAAPVENKPRGNSVSAIRAAFEKSNTDNSPVAAATSAPPAQQQDQQVHQDPLVAEQQPPPQQQPAARVQPQWGQQPQW